MKILITGLCLQGNKGGAALALSLQQEITKQLEIAKDTVEFIFSVPSGEEFQYELIWAKKYDVKVVEDFTLKDILPPFCIPNLPTKIKKIKTWLQTLSQVDLVIEMSAISYVGPPAGSIKNVITEGRLRYFLCSKLFHKPFLAWTQSYGPLSTPLIKTLAKLDLSNQPMIFCRGDDCLNAVKQLLPDKQIWSFPDVATTLQYNSSWGKDYLNSLMGKIDSQKLITISPSAVIYSKNQQHILELSQLCQYLSAQGYTILLVPHTYRVNRPLPNICDFAVASLIKEQVKDDKSITLLEEDLSPIELKSIISCAYIHIGGRYHTIVAALSSGIPCLSLSWHPKYRDIMRMYDVEEFVYNSINEVSIESLFNLVKKIEQNREQLHLKIKQNQVKVTEKIAENTNLFVKLIKQEINK